MKNIGIMRMVHVNDRDIDMGNYFVDDNGVRCLITSRELAEKYSYLVGCPVYARHSEHSASKRENLVEERRPSKLAI